MSLLYKEITTTLDDFKTYLINHKKEKSIRLFYDIETFKYNTKAENATQVCSRMYSFAIGFVDDDEDQTIRVVAFPNFYHFHTWFEKVWHKNKKTTMAKTRRKLPLIELVAHNNNHFDNHFVIHEMQLFFGARVLNAYVRNSISHDMQEKITEIRTSGVNTVLETRVRSMSNVEFSALINGIEYKTIDNVPKTGASLAELGKRLVKLNLIPKEDDKTQELEYDKFDVEEDLPDMVATNHAENIFKSLKDSEFHYIGNDIIVLAKSVLHYGILYTGFDWSKMTKTQNIKEAYLENELTSFQLLKEIGEGKAKHNLAYSDFRFDDKSNLFDFFNNFYKGGLNFYNPKYVGKLLEEYCFSIDINSSYPYVMYAFKVPTFIEEYNIYQKQRPVFLDLDNEHYWYMYEVEKNTFNKEVLFQLKSKIAKQMLRKYYFVTGEHIYLNTNTFRMIRDNFGLDIETIPVRSFVKWRCYDFGAKDKIAEFYYVKTQGKSSTEVVFKEGSPLDIEDTGKPYTGEHFSPEQQSIVKVNLNGLYGLPALRAFFNLGYRKANGDIDLISNGFKNKERNVAFSAFVTSQALYNLTSPFRHLTAEEIDDAFVYCDTDSLYLKKYVKEKFPASMFHSMNLGKWDVENETITKFYPLNHKKYVYETPDKKLHVRCGGVPLKNFNTDMSIEEFVTTQFHHGVTIKATRSIMNRLNTITIYESDMTLEQGSTYPLYFSPSDDDKYKRILTKVQNDMKDPDADEVDNYSGSILYIETPQGTISSKDIYPQKQTVENTQVFDAFINHSRMFENYLKMKQEI